MDERTRRTRRRIFTIIDFVILAALVAFMLYSGLVLKQITNLYRIVIAVGIFLFWLIENVIAPKLTDEFADKTPEQMSAYRKIAALGLLGYAGLVYFVVAMNHSTGFYGAVVYVVTVMLKRRLTDQYEGTAGEEAQAGDGEVIEGEVVEGEVREIADSSETAGDDAGSRGEIADPLSQDASTRLQRMGAAQQENAEEGEASAPLNMRDRVRRLNELSEEIEETVDE